MVELSRQQIHCILSEVQQADIEHYHLKDELIDHLCCDIEHVMEQGLSFESAFERIKEKIGFRGLQIIQEDTLYLINKNYRTMKKSMNIFGLLSTILIAGGTIFKMQQLECVGEFFFVWVFCY